jgi:hypothetical protein
MFNLIRHFFQKWVIKDKKAKIFGDVSDIKPAVDYIASGELVRLVEGPYNVNKLCRLLFTNF